MKLLLTAFLFLLLESVAAQDTTMRPLTMAEYNKAKTFTVKDLDKDTYVKFENTYVLDRYEMRKPYFVTGDDGLKKRIDIYQLLYKGFSKPLGTVIFYTTENGKLYTAVQPNFAADEKVWAQYFEDIHAIDKEEKAFVLKLSYILSKEMSFQLHKAANGGKAPAEDDKTYGSNICFPGDQLVAMANGTRKPLSQVQKGDEVLVLNSENKIITTEVTARVEHAAENYAVTELLLLHAAENKKANGVEIHLKTKTLIATPNHPVASSGVRKTMRDINIGDKLLCLDEATGAYTTYSVWNSTEKSGGKQKVYNLELATGNTMLINNVLVLQK